MIKIAIADDHLVVREGIASLLGKMGFEVIIQAANGVELLQRLKDADVLPDVCLLDISMPLKNGFETAEEIRDSWPEIRVLVVTVHSESLYFTRMIAAGAKGYVTKDARADVLREAVMSVYHKGAYFSDVEEQRYMRSIARGEIKHPKLTAAETEVLRLCCDELSAAEIATRMHTSAKAVDSHKHNLFNKLAVKTTAGLVKAAIKYGYVQVDTGTSPVLK
ncbi:MAG: response regulator transcription factor [Taibaiella sp.]|nr:response regulator transcription factor [Taibaiella sp.]